MKRTALNPALTGPIASEPVTLFDRYREAGLADYLVTEMDRRIKKQRRRRKLVTQATAALVLIGLVLFGAVPYLRDTATTIMPAARQATLALSDGSRAELNANSSLHTDFRYGRRHVRLDRGEAFFSVVSDPAHPFLVETKAGTVRVTGTQFNVRVAADANVEVTLLEGAVEIQRSDLSDQLPAAGGTLKLAPGEQATVTTGKSDLRELSPDEIAAATAWRQGRLVLDGMPLDEAAARFASYHGCIISIDARVAGLRLGGTYSLRDLPRFLEALRSTGAVQVLVSGERDFRILPR